MIMTDKQKYIEGNTVFVPQKYTNDDDEYKKLRKEKSDRVRRLKQNRVKGKAKMLKFILILFVFGSIIIYRYSKIYNMENNLVAIKNNIKVVQGENDNLKIDIMKTNSIEKVQDIAINKLHMVKPDSKAVKYIDLSNKHIADNKNVKNKGGFLYNLKSMIINGGI